MQQMEATTQRFPGNIEENPSVHFCKNKHQRRGFIKKFVLIKWEENALKKVCDLVHTFCVSNRFISY